jgi:phosphosulfolactate phosphohydrolase-like enzyme
MDESRAHCPLVLNDAARVVHRLWRDFPDFETAFRQSTSGRRVIEIGAEEDLAFCAHPDTSEVVPRLLRSRNLEYALRNITDAEFRLPNPD